MSTMTPRSLIASPLSTTTLIHRLQLGMTREHTKGRPDLTPGGLDITILRGRSRPPKRSCMDTHESQPLHKEVIETVKVEAAEALPSAAPLFERYIVKVDIAISAGAVPTKRPPIGF